MDELSSSVFASLSPSAYTPSMNGTPPAAGDSREEPADDAVVRQVLAGSTDAFRLVVERHSQSIFSLFYRSLGHYHTAQDLAQEVFLKAFQSLQSYRFEASLSTWLHRIALNHLAGYFASKRFRQWRRTRGGLELSERESAQGDENRSPEEELHHKQWCSRLRAAASDLSEKLRAVFLLCAFHGKSYEEAAEILDIPIGTVRSRFHEARVQLRRRIEREFGGL